ncbi:complex I NDUFA9 subunit family protein [Inmirania thermothiophila]|uniref:NADH dehydrogenase n=1 Tax=Inmirania thermothiophila TaxID=1750597 RepID=A0A3N1Y6T2_9GAMM|nr:complex I NDUFA9 subunit family protein [Inmirania thermothiophila]ROR34526.1 NADH dehydrogenase [Inmirania thermothiophila]
MRPMRICILGGTGFVGRHLIPRLLRGRHRLVVPTRHPHRHRDLLPQPAGNGNYTEPVLELVEADVHDEATLTRLLAGCDAAVNLVGILNDPARDGAGFRRVHVELPRKLVAACRAAQVPRLLHMSALNAGRGESRYLRTKGEGERVVREAEGLAVTVFRPSVIFGPDDRFFNRFATLLRLSPGVFPLACPEARLAPVYVGDVAQAFVTALAEAETAGAAYDLCGPRTYTLRELVRFTARTLGVRRLILGLPDALSRLQARILERLPGQPFTYDNYLSLQVASTCEGPWPAILGGPPASVEAVVPAYLARRTWRGRLSDFRRLARR